jgi:hypothetical protein
MVPPSLRREARWQSGHAAACKAVYAGSIPTLASNDLFSDVTRRHKNTPNLPQIWPCDVLGCPLTAWHWVGVHGRGMLPYQGYEPYAHPQ